MSTPHTETKSHAAYIKYCTEQIAQRQQRITTVNHQIAAAIAAVLDVCANREELKEDFELPDGQADWLTAWDLDAFDEQIGAAERALRTAAAIARPHPGSPLWPQIAPWNSGRRAEYAVRCLIVDLPEPVYVGGFHNLRDAQHKAEQLQSGAHVLHAEVKVRQHQASTWDDPQGAGDDD